MNYRAFKAWLVVLTVSVVCACASTEVRVDHAEGWSSSCTSFNWLRASEGPASLLEQRVSARVLAQLVAKGYERAAGDGDCEVTFALHSEEETRARPRVGVGVGAGSRGVGGGVGVSIPVPGRGANEEFSIVVVDAKSNEAVWTGAIELESKASELTAREAVDLVDRVLANFPDRN